MTAILLIGYGPFNCNSGGHIAHFANELARLGHAVAVCAGDDPAAVADFGPPRFACITHDELSRDPGGSLRRAFPGSGRYPAIIHAWTPRERVRTLTQRVREGRAVPYVVHLEDNEELIAASQLGAPPERLAAMEMAVLDRMVPPHLSHPRRYRGFLAGAAGLTGIAEPLREFVPADLPWHLLRPGVDAGLFRSDLPPARRQALLARHGVADGDRVIVYNGNMHPANRREMFSLYAAIAILRRRGHPVTLLRTGADWCIPLDESFRHLGAHCRDLGLLDRPAMIEVMKLADLFVQPGAPDRFNRYRLPSKLPEFLAMGRPVVLPRANLGLELADGEEAVLLDRGDGVEIADKVELLLRDEARANAIGAAGRSFALRQLDWSASASGLAAFYARLAGPSPAAVREPSPRVAASALAHTS